MRFLAFEPSTAFQTIWGIFLLVVAVVIVPLLLGLIMQLIRTAVQLNRNAAVAARAAKAVRRNTDPVPALADTLRLVREILEVTKVAERHGVDLEVGLTRPAPPELARR